MEKLTYIWFKITQSSQVVELVGSSVDEEVAKRDEQTMIHGRVVAAWEDMMLSQVTHLVSSSSSW